MRQEHPFEPKSERIPSRYIAFGGIVVSILVLGFIAVLTIRTLVTTREGLDNVNQAGAVSSAYTDLALAISLSEVYVNRRAELGPDADVKLTEAFKAVGVAWNHLREVGTADIDRRFLAEMEARYSQQAKTRIDYEAGTDPSTLALPENDTSILAVVQSLMVPTIRSRAETTAQLADMKTNFSGSATTILTAILASLPILGVLFVTVNRYERKDAIKASELQRLSTAALTDGLTGLGNHRSFQEELHREVARSARQESPISIVMIDVDDFKEVNDSLGHAHGDAVLAQVGHLMAFMRGADRAFRVGGDEFALIMPDTDAAAAYEALERLRLSVREAIEGASISVGVCTTDNGETNAALLRDQADSALYEAKHRGKNQVVAYDPILIATSDLTASKMQAVRDVLAGGIVDMWFQPIFRFGTEKLLAFEALLRLPDQPQLSGPEEAFMVAQHMGRSRDLDMLCTSTALESAAKLPAGAKIFINLDPATLMHADFVAADLARMVDEAGVSRGDVVFEVTEKTDAPLPRLVRRVRAIRDEGFAMALDDVGSGNSGLEMLRLIPFDYVKIDRSVVLDAMDGGPGRAIILAIVAFARESGAFMIAEGIETQEMLEAVKLDADGLQRFWIQGVQGFLLGKPRPDLEPAVRARRAA